MGGTADEDAAATVLKAWSIVSKTVDGFLSVLLAGGVLTAAVADEGVAGAEAAVTAGTREDAEEDAEEAARNRCKSSLDTMVVASISSSLMSARSLCVN